MMVIGMDLAFWKEEFNCVTRSQAAGNPRAAKLCHFCQNMILPVFKHPEMKSRRNISDVTISFCHSDTTVRTTAWTQ